MSGLCVADGGLGKFFCGHLTDRADAPHSTRVPRLEILKT
jgi:hypothetical protein